MQGPELTASLAPPIRFHPLKKNSGSHPPPLEDCRSSVDPSSTRDSYSAQMTVSSSKIGIGLYDQTMQSGPHLEERPPFIQHPDVPPSLDEFSLGIVEAPGASVREEEERKLIDGKVFYQPGDSGSRS